MGRQCNKSHLPRGKAKNALNFKDIHPSIHTVHTDPQPCGERKELFT
jgi:hypothetical protein